MPPDSSLILRSVIWTYTRHDFRCRYCFLDYYFFLLVLSSPLVKLRPLPNTHDKLINIHSIHTREFTFRYIILFMKLISRIIGISFHNLTVRHHDRGQLQFRLRWLYSDVVAGNSDLVLAFGLGEVGAPRRLGHSLHSIRLNRHLRKHESCFRQIYTFISTYGGHQ